MRMRTYRITLTRIFSVTPQGHTMPVPKWFKLELAPTRLREIRTAIMLAGGNSTCLLAPAQPETPAMHSTRAPNLVSQPNIALPGNENRPGRWAIR